MKKKLLLMPLLAFMMTGCVLYNGQGKPGTKSSAAPQDSSVIPTSDNSQLPPSSMPGSQSQPAPSSSQNPEPAPVITSNFFVNTSELIS